MAHVSMKAGRTAPKLTLAHPCCLREQHLLLPVSQHHKESQWALDSPRDLWALAVSLQTHAQQRKGAAAVTQGGLRPVP